MHMWRLTVIRIETDFDNVWQWRYDVLFHDVLQHVTDTFRVKAKLHNAL